MTVFEGSHVDELDLEWFTLHMREIDSRELRHAAGPGNELDCLEYGLLHAAKRWVALDERGRPLAVWGVNEPDVNHRALVWLLMTDELVEDYAQPFLRHSRRFVDEMHTVAPELYNFVHGDNDVARRWLIWLGFRVDDKPVAILGEPYHYFWRTV